MRVWARDWLKSWTDALLVKDLLIAGYLLDCNRCASRHWYPSPDIGQYFRCNRCGGDGVVPAPQRRTFRLNEAFFQFRQHGGQVVTFALSALRAEASESFLYRPETNLSGPGGTREVDGIALVDGRLVLLEAKTKNSLSTTEMSYYNRAARAARVQRMIFATTSSRRLAVRTPSCPCRGTGNRDHAWDDGAQSLISTARGRLESLGTEVDTWCKESLTGHLQSRVLDYYRPVDS